MTLQLDSYIVKNTDVVGHGLPHEVVLLQPAQGTVKVLNEVGARIWELADGARTMREIIAVICTEYMVSVEQAEGDVWAFIAQLIDQNMVAEARSSA